VTALKSGVDAIFCSNFSHQRGTSANLSRFERSRAKGISGRMERAEEYRRFARECLEMASTVEDSQLRASLLQMAQVWLRLAQQHAEGSESTSD
jgi:phage gp46-like protein